METVKDFFVGLISFLIFAVFIYYVIYPKWREWQARRDARNTVPGRDEPKDYPGANDPR